MRVPVVFIDVVPVRLANPRLALSCGAYTKVLQVALEGHIFLSGRRQRKTAGSECVQFNLQTLKNVAKAPGDVAIRGSALTGSPHLVLVQ